MCSSARSTTSACSRSEGSGSAAAACRRDALDVALPAGTNYRGWTPPSAFRTAPVPRPPEADASAHRLDPERWPPRPLSPLRRGRGGNRAAASGRCAAIGDRARQSGARADAGDGFKTGPCSGYDPAVGLWSRAGSNPSGGCRGLGGWRYAGGQRRGGADDWRRQYFLRYTAALSTGRLGPGGVLLCAPCPAAAASGGAEAQRH